MAIREIVPHTDNFIRKKSKPIKNFDESLWELLDDMKETLEANPGAGLSAVQVGVLKRIIVIDLYEDGMQFVLINPEIIEESGSQTGSEGCLSVPGKYGIVTRPNYVKVKALNEEMEEVSNYVKKKVQESKTARNAPVVVVSTTSAAGEIKKFKELLDMGIITQEEFDAKKKQLLGL